MNVKPLYKTALATFAFLLTFFITSAFGDENRNDSVFPHITNKLEGIGYGSDEHEARQQALSSIISQINQLINFNRCQINQAKTTPEYCSGFSFHFDLPIKGVQYTKLAKHESSKQRKEFGQKAEVSRHVIAENFVAPHQALINELKSTLKIVRNDKKHANTSLIKNLWLSSQKIVAYENLLNIFGVQKKASLDPNIINKIEALQLSTASSIKSLDEIPTILLSLGASQKAFIHAPSPYNSVEMTPFSEKVRFIIYQHFTQQFPSEKVIMRGLKAKGTQLPESCYHNVLNMEINCDKNTNPNAVYTDPKPLLLGHYTILSKDLILLYYALTETNNGIIDFKFIKIPTTLLHGTRYQPINSNFDRQLHQNILPSSNFRSDLSSSRGKRNILLTEGEEFGLKIKLNSAGFYYLVGHVIHEKQQYSYLVELDPNIKRFVGRINAHQINRWINIGEFIIEPPFGVEHLQLITANYDLSDQLPPTQWHEDLGYHLITGSQDNAIQGLDTVRGLQRVCTPQTTRGFQRNCGKSISLTELDSRKEPSPVFEHESVLSYTSLPSSE